MTDLTCQTFKRLSGQLAVFCFIVLFSQVVQANGALLFVTTDGKQNQIHKSDLTTYKSFQNSLTGFFTKQTHQSPKIIEARLSNIRDLPSFIETTVNNEDKIDLIVFQGHGNHKEMIFDLANRFSGSELSDIISDDRVLNRMTKEQMSIYFPACQCGLKPNDETLSFQEAFSEAFVRSAAMRGKKFVTFQTIAHPNLFNGFATMPGLGYMSWIIQKSGIYPIYQKILLAGQRVPGKWGEALVALNSGQIRSQLAVLATVGLSYLMPSNSFEMRLLAFAPAISAFALTYLELVQVGVVKNLIYKNGEIIKGDRPLRPVMRSLAKRNSRLLCKEVISK